MSGLMYCCSDSTNMDLSLHLVIFHRPIDRTGMIFVEKIGYNIFWALKRIPHLAAHFYNSMQSLCGVK